MANWNWPPKPANILYSFTLRICTSISTLYIFTLYILSCFLHRSAGALFLIEVLCIYLGTYRYRVRNWCKWYLFSSAGEWQEWRPAQRAWWCDCQPDWPGKLTKGKMHLHANSPVTQCQTYTTWRLTSKHARCTMMFSGANPVALEECGLRSDFLFLVPSSSSIYSAYWYFY